MNLTIQINEDKNVNISSNADKNTPLSSDTTSPTSNNGGTPKIEGIGEAYSSGGETSSIIDIGGPPAWLMEEINASKASSTINETSKELIGSDGGKAPEF